MFHQSKIKNMKNLLSLMLVCGMALNVSAQHAAHSRAASPVGGGKSAPALTADYRQGQVIVKFTSSSVMQGKRRVKGRLAPANNAVGNVLQQIGAEEAEQLMPLMGAANGNAARRAKAQSGKDTAEKDLSTLYVLRFDSTKTTVERAIEQLKVLDEVEYAEPNYIIRAVGAIPSSKSLTTATMQTTQTHSFSSSPLRATNGQDDAASTEDPLRSEQWYLDAINMPALWEKPIINPKRPVIAILDTGVDITHPDLAANIWTNTAEQGNDEDGNGFTGDLHGWNFIDDTPDVTDLNGHGTHCAGIAAAVGDNGIGIKGANPDALIMPIKVLNDADGGGDEATIIRALDYATANGADVISMSFAGYIYSIALDYAIRKAYTTSVLVASAGNNNACMVVYHTHGNPEEGNLPHFPAAFKYVIGVQASSETGELADFSNFDCDGPLYCSTANEVSFDWYNYELLAPGTGIVSTDLGHQYQERKGTSMSCPLVAGAISSLMQRKNVESRKDLLHSLVKTSSGVVDMLATYEFDGEIAPQTITKTFGEVEICFVEQSDHTLICGTGESLAYYDCDFGGSEITIPDEIDGVQVTAIADYAFGGANKITSINLPKSLRKIGAAAFAGCSIKDLIIPTGVVEISDMAFSGTQLLQLNIPPSVIHIGDRILEDCSQLTAISVDNKNPRYDSRNQCNAIVETKTNKIIQGCGNTRIPTDVTVIGKMAFRVCNDLTSLNIPSHVTTIEEGAFACCEYLKEVTLHEGIQRIEDGAFGGCYRLSNIVLPSTLEFIGKSAFGRCDSLKTIIWPNKIDSINGVFNMCYGLETIEIPEGVKCIGDLAFTDCHNLTSVTIPASVESIKSTSFGNCI